MHEVGFVVRMRAGGRGVHEIVPVIDGQPLTDLIDEFELTAGDAPCR